MPSQLLYHPKIRAAFDQLGAKVVPQGMGCPGHLAADHVQPDSLRHRLATKVR